MSQAPYDPLEDIADQLRRIAAALEGQVAEDALAKAERTAEDKSFTATTAALTKVTSSARWWAR